MSSILLIGETPSQEDVRAGRPFTGYAGQELDMMLADAGLSRVDVQLTNVFDACPPNNDLNAWAVPRKDLKSLINPALPFAAIPCKKGAVHPQYVQHNLARLYREIAEKKPNVIGALGNAAVVALCGVSGITKLRGALHFYRPAALDALPVKVIPTYAPRMVLASYEWRPHAVADFIKIRNEAASPYANLRKRKLYLEPTICEVEDWAAYLAAKPFLAFDIETKARQITCIGFAPSPAEAYVIPFWGRSGNYWENPEDELRAHNAVERILCSPATKVAQNGLYDVSYLFKYGIKVANFLHDTMILHHALYPALPKGLDFLGSIYANERAWKRWRVRGGDTHELKREE